MMFLEKEKTKNVDKLQEILLAFVEANLMKKRKARELLYQITGKNIFSDELEMFFTRLANFHVFFEKTKCKKEDLDDFQKDVAHTK